MTSICPTRLSDTATRNILLENSPTSNTDLVWDRHESALNMSNRTKQVNVIVVSRGVMRESDIWKQIIFSMIMGNEEYKSSRE